ncbi:hypothetical protein Q8A67_020992 [Cirrhinus molitorella]|uniref:Uncharacterized protein n=1 Tax=Cirrhinus molitorella TaxID=172907 RepID=A0AA88PCV3_9TELE|nr:hypothetical protein Q8A67_020992 [Cirrhinus molitorella]
MPTVQGAKLMPVAQGAREDEVVNLSNVPKEYHDLKEVFISVSTGASCGRLWKEPLYPMAFSGASMQVDYFPVSDCGGAASPGYCSPRFYRGGVCMVHLFMLPRAKQPKDSNEH